MAGRSGAFPNRRLPAAVAVRLQALFGRRGPAPPSFVRPPSPELRLAAAPELRPAAVVELRPSSVRSPPRAPSGRPAHARPRSTAPLLGMGWGRGAMSRQFGGAGRGSGG
jgi:hypothetical protein